MLLCSALFRRERVSTSQFTFLLSSHTSPPQATPRFHRAQQTPSHPSPPLPSNQPHLTNGSVHPFTHRSLRLMLLVCMQPLTRMRFLKLTRSLERCQVNRIGIDELLRRGADVRDQSVQEVEGHAFSDDDAEDFCLLFCRGKGIVCGGSG